jgi:hypothetical protein
MRALRTGMLALGIAMLLLGLWWLARNRGYAGDDFMAKDFQWFWRGLALAGMGAVVAALSRRL